MEFPAHGATRHTDTESRSSSSKSIYATATFALNVTNILVAYAPYWLTALNIIVN